MTYTHQPPKTAVKTLVAVAVAIATATSVWFAGAGTALAPEPTRLTQQLYGNTGATAQGYYLNSGKTTSVLKWPGTWTAGTSAAGTPCSTYDLWVGEDASKVIVATGSYRKCQ